ncbi:MAG TPA: DNA translocase FtsK [Clostridiales bacterium]|nr:DNA translocase FtsK [Clostridiales bacterium]
MLTISHIKGDLLVASNKKRKKTTRTTKTSKTNKTKSNSKNTIKQNEIEESGIIQDEIIIVITFVVSILLFLSNFDLSGVFGELISGITFGLIGVLAYALPFIVFFIIAFHISNRGNRRAGRKILSAVVFFVALAALIQLISADYNSDMKIFEYYTNSSDYRTGGGIIGGILVMVFCGLFDTVATYIILISMILITLIVISGKAILTLFAMKGNEAIHEYKENSKLRKEQQLAYEAEHPEEVPGRRPPKTFLFDGSKKSKATKKKKTSDNKLIDFEDKRDSTESSKNVDTLTNLNLDHLFQTEDQDYKVPTFEDELREKFGRSDNKDENVVTRTASPETIASENQSIDSSTPVDNTHTKAKVDTSTDTTEVEKLDINQIPEEKPYVFPPLNILSVPKQKINKLAAEKSLRETAIKLQSTLESFGVKVTITNVSRGPAVTRYELQPEQGVKVSKITSLSDDIKLNLAASDIRIEAPIPGKAAIGIEVPNKENSMVSLREMLEGNEFKTKDSGIAFAVGKDIGGQTIVTDIAKMPHLLIAGATGSGKSVCINTLIMSILYKYNPSDVRMIMIDPKVVELNVYNGIPHLLIPVVTDPKKASAALNWAVVEMTERYKKFADAGVRDLKGYNEKAGKLEHLEDEAVQKLPQVVIIIDELADLMMVAAGEVEDSICRLAQLARAAGIHLVIATQRPSVNVITGLIKANIPSRIAFSVSSAIDSRTILDGSGAEKLLGKGDMLFFPTGYPKPVRIQGAFISDKEVNAVVDYIKKNNNPTEYSEEINEKLSSAVLSDNKGNSNAVERDEYFVEAGKFIIEKDKASIGMLQRVYRIGFNRAARIMDQLSEVGVVGPEEGTKPRKVLMTDEEFSSFIEERSLI